MPACTTGGTQLHTPCMLTKSAAGTCEDAGVLGQRRQVGFEEADILDARLRRPGPRRRDMGGVEVDRGDRPVRVARRQDQRTEALAAAQLQIAHRIVAARHR